MAGVGSVFDVNHWYVEVAEGEVIPAIRSTVPGEHTLAVAEFTAGLGWALIVTVTALLALL